MPGIVTTAPPRKGNQTPISLPWGLLNSCRHTPASLEPDSSAVDLSVLTVRQGSRKGEQRKRQRLLVRRAALEKAGVLHNNSTLPKKGSQPRTTPQPGGVKKGLLTAPPGGLWECDSGFSSEASLPSSGRCSPCFLSNPRKLVALDCEMVGTGPGGRCSEVARCSLVGYHGDVIYDKYIRPLGPVEDYRTRWSGIRKHHLRDALPFREAQREILQILKGRVVVGHALHNDFRALGYDHPREMTRDTSRQRLLRLRAGLPVRASVSLRNLTKKLLNRDIQVRLHYHSYPAGGRLVAEILNEGDWKPVVKVGREGHCSVEDATAAMELYRLVEVQWEQEALSRLPAQDTHSDLSPSHYMNDQYWPEGLNEDCQ
ncbi:UNVERIFIED_CONTAM: hypothetical protein FKN15_074317 [Acipenser sinensis]